MAGQAPIGPTDSAFALALFDYSAPMAPPAIGPAFGRTGTDSMREALRSSDFGPCHHMLEVNAPKSRSGCGAPS